jgi:hypothetical protein
MKREFIASCRDRRSGSDWVHIPVLAYNMDEAFKRARFAVIDKLPATPGAIIDVKCASEGFAAVYTYQGSAVEARQRDIWMGAEAPIRVEITTDDRSEIYNIVSTSREQRRQELGGEWPDDRRPNVFSGGYLINPGVIVPDWADFCEWCKDSDVREEELNRFDSRFLARQEQYLAEMDSETQVEHPGFG